MDDGRLGYLFTDMDGSTERWERSPIAMQHAVALHDQIIDGLVQSHGGLVKDRAGDGVFAVFNGGDPLGCALAIQLAMQREDWTAIGGLGVRIGVHAGEDQVAVNRAARMTASGCGGQIVVSKDAAEAYALPDAAWLTDLGLSHLKDIEEPLRLFSLAHPEMERTEFPPLRLSAASGSPATGFPTPFFGRQTECEELARLLDKTETRVITLVGPGGNGKTRLAARVGAAASESCAVWFAPLDATSNGPELIAAVARALRFPMHGAAPPAEQLLAHLRDKQGLLILDNADAVIAEAAAFVSNLGTRCESMIVLTTSRAPLSISGETLYRVTGFPSPGCRPAEVQTSPAFQLFTHEARAGRADFELTESEYEAFRELCDLLNGSPLALRLAAQWCSVLSIAQILDRVHGDLDFLRASDLNFPERHHSLRRVFEGSWSLLSESERRGLARLSVFCGGFDAMAVERASGVDVGTLRTLEQKGLIEKCDHRRFVMHALVRDYAIERLAETGEETNARVRHADYYFDYVRTEFASAAAAGQRIVLDRLEREAANILAAWRHAIDKRAWKKIQGVAEPLFYSLVLRARYRDAAGFFEQDAGDPSIDAYFACLLANCLVQQGELDQAAAAAQKAIETDECPQLARAHAHQALGLIAHARGQFDTARAQYEAALEIRRAHEDHIGCSYTTASLAILHLLCDDAENAREMIRESFRRCERIGNRSGLMIVQFLAGDLALREGRTDDAKASYSKCLEIEAEVQHPQHRARVLTKLGGLCTEMGDFGGALRYHREALACAIQIGDQRHKTEALLAIGNDMRRQGYGDKAKTRYIQAMRIALDLAARPLVIRCLLDLARLEAETGNLERAEQLAMVLAGADLGPRQSEYDALLATLPRAPISGSQQPSPETAVQDIIDAAELAWLRL
ncbi:MAG: ATP-binding protein [Caulobacteraceae bacterium]